MTYRANPLLQKLDSAAEATGMPALARHTQQHASLPFRIMPLINLAFGVGGLLVQIWAPMAGWIMLMCLWPSAFLVLLAGPMPLPEGGRRDERERALIRAGHFVGLAAVAVLAIGGCFLIAIAGGLSILRHSAPPWTPTGIQDWVALGFFLLIVEINVAVLAISWKLPWRMPKDDDET